MKQTNNLEQIPKYIRYSKSQYKDYFLLILFKKLSYKYSHLDCFKLISKRIVKANLKRFITRTKRFFDIQETVEQIYNYIIQDYIYKPKKYNYKIFTLTPSIKKEIKNYTQEQVKKSNLEKYGYEYPFQSDEIQSKLKQTCLEKYGYENLFYSKNFQDKIKQDNLERYGVTNLGNSTSTRIKIYQKYLSNNNVNTDSQDLGCLKTITDFIKTIKRTHKLLRKEIKKYNDLPLQHEKAELTCLKKYGVPDKQQLKFKKYKELSADVAKKFINNNRFDIKAFANYFNMSKCTANKYKQTYGINVPNMQNQSAQQDSLFNYIKAEKILNDRKLIKPREIDILLPKQKLAIEFNGLLFHSEGAIMHLKFIDKDSNYHLSKTLECESKGYQLFHIFENEDIEIWKSMINNKLGLNKKIYARKCIIKELKFDSIRKFLDDNHLQGSANSIINLGLYYKNRLVQVMTFSKPRFNKNYQYELIRLCTKKFTNVVGGASKLFSYFIKNYNPESIISYANRRFSRGSIYETLGFKFLRATEPNYFYFKINENILYSRIKFQKHKLKDLLENYDEKLSEAENMFNNNYRRIYDSGNLVYTYHNSKCSKM